MYSQILFIFVFRFLCDKNLWILTNRFLILRQYWKNQWQFFVRKRWKIWWNQFWWMWMMRKSFLFRRLDGGFCHIGNVRTSIVVLQKNYYIRSMKWPFMNHFVEWIQMLSVRIDHLAICKMFLKYMPLHPTTHTAWSFWR